MWYKLPAFVEFTNALGNIKRVMMSSTIAGGGSLVPISGGPCLGGVANFKQPHSLDGHKVYLKFPLARHPRDGDYFARVFEV